MTSCTGRLFQLTRFCSDANYLINATIAMAHGLEVVAECAETEEQLTHLTEQGCDFAQGYLFSKPFSATELTAMIPHTGRVRQTHAWCLVTDILKRHREKRISGYFGKP